MAYSNVIDYIQLTALAANAVDSGDLTVARRGVAGISGTTYGFTGGGYTGAVSNVVDYINTTAPVSNAVDTGDLTVARDRLAGVQGNAYFGSVYGYFCGGCQAIATPYNTIDYIVLATAVQNAVDRGDLTVARYNLGGCCGVQYDFLLGGADNGVGKNTIDYMDNTLAVGNAIDRGDLPSAVACQTGVAMTR